MILQDNIQNLVHIVSIVCDVPPSHAQNIKNLAQARTVAHESRWILVKGPYGPAWIRNYPHYACVPCYAKVHHVPIEKVQAAVAERRYPLWEYDNTGGKCVCEVCGEERPIIA